MDLNIMIAKRKIKTANNSKKMLCLSKLDMNVVSWFPVSFLLKIPISIAYIWPIFKACSYSV